MSFKTIYALQNETDNLLLKDGYDLSREGTENDMLNWVEYPVICEDVEDSFYDKFGERYMVEPEVLWFPTRIAAETQIARMSYAINSLPEKLQFDLKVVELVYKETPTIYVKVGGNYA